MGVALHDAKIVAVIILADLLLFIVVAIGLMIYSRFNPQPFVPLRYRVPLKMGQELRQEVGLHMVAWACGLHVCGRADETLRGYRKVSALQYMKLRTLHEVATITKMDIKTMEVWLLGMNPTFDGETPIARIRDAGSNRELQEVIGAAKSYASGGYA